MSSATSESDPNASTSSPALVAAAWAIVGVPLAYGLWQTLVKASALFTG